MDIPVLLEVAIPTFTFAAIGVGLTYYEFHIDFKKLDEEEKDKKKRTKKIKSSE